MRLIAVCGLKRSGKDMVARYVSERYGYTHVQIADKLKQITKTAFGFTDDDVETDAKDRIHPVWGVSPRVCMDYLGTHVFQHDIKRILPHCPDRCFWINDVLRTHFDHLATNANHFTTNSTKHVVISDLRFEHELRAIRRVSKSIDLKTTVIRICRDGTSADGLESESETQGLVVDHTIHNNGTLDDLFEQVDRIVQK